MSFRIAIDGPAGAGKSTIAKRIAQIRKAVYVDTGAMYRAMALFLLRNGIAPEDGEGIAEICEKADITIRYEDGVQVVYLNGENVNSYLRTEEVGNMASKSSAHKRVREKLVELQRKIAESTDVVMDGRDIGTCVLPDAEVKIYLTANSRVRAKRRYDELRAKGEDCDLDAIQKDIEARDYRDMHRENSPLKQAEDAVVVDSSEQGIDEVVKAILDICEKREIKG